MTLRHDDLLYVNHAGTSWPKPPPVMEAVEEAQHAAPQEWPDLIDESVNEVASFFRIENDRLLITPGCTSALNLAIAEFAWQPGDRVLTSHFEHHALHRNLLGLAHRGVKITTARFGDHELVDLDHVEQELKSSGIRLVAMTAACNVTGLMLPVEEVIQLSHRYGAKVLIDGAQVAGWCDTDLKKLGVDLFTFAGHKGLQSPLGIGGLYVANGVPMQCPTAVCNISSQPLNESLPSFCDAGSMNVSALAGLAAGCRWLDRHTDRLGKARQLAQAFSQQLKQDQRVVVYHDADFCNRMPTVAFTLKGASMQELQRKVAQHNIAASVGFQCAPRTHEALGTSAEGVCRISFGALNRDDIVDPLCEAILA